MTVVITAVTIAGETSTVASMMIFNLADLPPGRPFASQSAK